MLKKILLSALVIAMLFVIVSCKDEPEEAPVSVFYPGFIATASMDDSRGMTAFPEGCPFVDPNKFKLTSETYTFFQEKLGNPNMMNIWLGCNAMSALPVFPNLSASTDKPNKIENSLKNTWFNAYGFPTKITEAQCNEDGIYLRYDIYEINGNQRSQIGVIDYYFSAKDNTFSYRELVLPFMEEKQPNFGDNIIYFEMNRVKVDPETGDFTVGIKEGSLDKDNCLKLEKLGIQHDNADSNKFALMLRVYDTAFRTKTVGDSSDVASFVFHTKEVCTTGTNIHDLVKDNFKYTSDSNHTYKNSQGGNEQPYVYLINDKQDLKNSVNLLDLFYDNADSFINHTKAQDVKSLEDFDEIGLNLKSNIGWDKDMYDIGLCTRYVINKEQTGGKGATFGPNAEMLWQIDPVFVNYKTTKGSYMCLASFEIFPEYESQLNDFEKFAKTHLKVCGLSDTSFISDDIKTEWGKKENPPQ